MLLKLHDTLSKDFWIQTDSENVILRQEIRLRLLKVAYEFYRDLNINARIKDIIFTGSMSGYNYNEKSDVDLHLLIVFDDIDENLSLVEDWLLSKISLWNNKHNIIIKNHEVEIYVENFNCENISESKYSLITDHWLIFPKRKIVEIDQEKVDRLTNKVMQEIDKIEVYFNDHNDSIGARITNNAVNNLKNKIKELRKKSLANKGVYGIGNLIFKELRNNNHMTKLINLGFASYDKMFSENDIVSEENDLSIKKAIEKKKDEVTLEDFDNGSYYPLDDDRYKVSIDEEKNEISESILIENLIKHAKFELKRAGLFDKDSDYNGMIGRAVLELIKTFSKQGHSGFSALWVISLFKKLAEFETLTPITNDQNEWNDVSEECGGKSVWQNKRNPAYFSDDNCKTWYRVDEKTIKEGIILGVKLFEKLLLRESYFDIDQNQIYLYHATSTKNVDDILKNGIKPSIKSKLPFSSGLVWLTKTKGAASKHAKKKYNNENIVVLKIKIFPKKDKIYKAMGIGVYTFDGVINPNRIIKAIYV